MNSDAMIFTGWPPSWAQRCGKNQMLFLKANESKKTKCFFEKRKKQMLSTTLQGCNETRHPYRRANKSLCRHLVAPLLLRKRFAFFLSGVGNLFQLWGWFLKKGQNFSPLKNKQRSAIPCFKATSL